jgi:hypothetical protein
MGAAISRCTNRDTGVSANLADIGQRILDNQPNWLTTPSKWRPRTCNHRPIRYRTPTPYPKDDRRPLPDQVATEPAQTAPITTSASSEKPIILETSYHAPSRHITVIEPPKHLRHPLSNSNISEIQLPPAALSITYDHHPRRNRFERIS